MHVLSTPPAFILSQDQTLMLKVDRSSDYLAWLIDPKPSLLGFCSEFSQIQRSKPDLFNFLNFQGFTYCLIFNYQGSLLLSISAATHLYYHSRNFLSTTFSILFFAIFTAGFIWKKERRKRDLNPRAGFPTYTLSRGASSAS